MIEEKIRQLADQYADNLREKIEARKVEMSQDSVEHYLIYEVLGITEQEGILIDLYQNTGRFLYKYAGAFMEEVTQLCFSEKFGEDNAKKVRIPNTESHSPKTYEIDCLVNQIDAYEIKWRDATTDGDHVKKEIARVNSIKAAGYRPIRIMFFYPNRKQAQRIQLRLEEVYQAIGGQYYYGETAWKHVKEVTGIDLKAILEKIAADKEAKA